MTSTFDEQAQVDENYFGQVRLKDDDGIDYHDPKNILTMKNIHKTYLLGIEGVPALRGVSMCIKRGDFVCIFGTSGGGKTTMLNIIGTIDKPTKGDMKLCGKTINHKTTDKDLAFLRLKNIGFVFQTFNLLSSLTALENVEMPMILLGELNAAERRERAISLLTKVGMKDRVDHVPSQLSGGEQQRVTIARAMANNPDILLLDEPTGDLDTVNTSIVMKLLTDLNRNDGVTLVMVTHDVGLKMYSDRVIWMRDGKIQRIETVNPLSKKEQFEKLYREIDHIQSSQKGGVHSVITNNNNKKVTEVRRPIDYKSIASFTAAGGSLTGASSSMNKKPIRGNNINNNNNNPKPFIVESYSNSSSTVDFGSTSTTSTSNNNNNNGNNNNNSHKYRQQPLLNINDDNDDDDDDYNQDVSSDDINNIRGRDNSYLFDDTGPSSSSSKYFGQNNNNNRQQPIANTNDIYININQALGVGQNNNNNNNNNTVENLTNDLDAIL
ncbi:putative non-transporter ABC protein [Cavenderia fasciculata]|uniref:Non-transporter ABC protein n=1 Tax=Cavenderia fasciculata TaxID=261658 RepID=F4Q889_CACFS|nr:putative non-transporter ABC protein [Cavenderia fasciculata]EGG15989.1 putative non-transporter ABC protein [Cavenderia fasciculata]|eukprot:XP_004352314.1 putative non-transporter ABC protein [Cavenderia fasciculata]